MDDVDRAQEINEAHLADSLERLRYGTYRDKACLVSTECVVCGEEIPERRRQAVPGCTRCVSCQELLENWRPL